MSKTTIDEKDGDAGDGAVAETPQPQPKENLKDDTHEDLVEEQQEQEVDPGAGIVPEGPLLPWRVAKSLERLRAQVNAKWPQRLKGSDGTIGDASHMGRESDHNAWIVDGSNRVVTALDITNDPAHGVVSNDLARKLIASKDPRIKYVISNRKMARSYPKNGLPAWTWQPYNGANPHTHHMHISVKADKASYDSTKDWQV